MSDRDNAVTGEQESPTEQERPLLQVVNPDATPEEIAALVAVFSALGSGGEPAPRPNPSEWSANHRRVRPNHLAGPGGWRSSGMPR